MADAPGPEPSNPIYFILAIIVTFFIVWLYTGGPGRFEAENPNVTPPTAEEIGQP